MRPVQLMESPVAAPYLCGKCGMGNSDREYFIDLGFDTTFNNVAPTGMWVDGCVYLCSVCFDNLCADVAALKPQLEKMLAEIALIKKERAILELEHAAWLSEQERIRLEHESDQYKAHLAQQAEAARERASAIGKATAELEELPPIPVAIVEVDSTHSSSADAVLSKILSINLEENNTPTEEIEDGIDDEFIGDVVADDSATESDDSDDGGEIEPDSGHVDLTTPLELGTLT